jgi:small conductance mechanosensitive channel
MDKNLETISQVKSTLIDLALRFGPRLLAAIVIIAVGLFVSRWLSRWADRGLSHFHLEPPVRLLLGRVVRALVLVLFLIMALQNLGVELLPLIAGLGIAGAGIALAMQGVLGNVAAGLSIIFTRPYRVGEYISISGEEGRVEAINLFSTTLSHPDRSLIVIPNRKIAGETLHNFGKILQVNIALAVAPGTDLDGALAAVHEVLKSNSRVLRDPSPLVQTVVLPDSTVQIAVKPWVSVDDFGAAHGEINKAIVETFRARHITFPVPQREIRMLQS